MLLRGCRPEVGPDDDLPDAPRGEGVGIFVAKWYECLLPSVLLVATTTTRGCRPFCFPSL